MESAIYGTLGLALVTMLSGLGILAVRFPQTYNTYGRYFLYALAGLAALAFAFSWGAGFGIYAVRGLLKPEAAAAALAIKQRIDGACQIVAFGSLAFMGFLLLLAKISLYIHENERGAKDEDDKGV